MKTPTPSEGAMQLTLQTIMDERNARLRCGQGLYADQLAGAHDWISEQWRAAVSAEVTDGWGDDELIVCRPPMADVVPIRSGGGDAA